MKTIRNIMDCVEELDFFAPNIRLRYKSHSDYKTLTSAIMTILLILFFSFVFIQMFINMINKNTIVQNISNIQQSNPLFTQLSTNNFMFAISLNGIDMTNDPRYFNYMVSNTYVINGVKSKIDIGMSPCTLDQWTKFEKQMQIPFQKLSLSQWLCPAPGTMFQLEGKYSSDIFRYIKIGVSKCSGVVNGLGCRSDDQIKDYLKKNMKFQLNIYYINKLLNPGEKVPSQIFLDDSNYFTFSYNLGGIANLYLSDYSIQTDNSLLPYQDKILQKGIIVKNSATQNVYQTNPDDPTGEFFKFYLRKSPNFYEISRSFYKFDELLAYIGGLFGLIALVINVPLYYYNLLCYQLSLATDMYTQNKQNNQPKNNQTPSFSINRFNFITYIFYAPYHLLKKLGFSKLKNKYAEPFHCAVKEVRKQIDVCKILKELSYFNRVVNCILDQHQIKLLHLHERKDLYEAQVQRKNYKLHKRLSSKLLLDNEKRENNQNERQNYMESQKIKKAFNILKKKKDKISRRILKNLDIQIIKKFGQEDMIRSIRQLHQNQNTESDQQIELKNIQQITLKKLQKLTKQQTGVQLADSRQNLQINQIALDQKGMQTAEKPDVLIKGERDNQKL